jgi:prephenate dehydratase
MTGRPWEYMFYADVTIPGNEEADAALVELRKVCSTVKELGRYRVLNPASKR